MYAALRGMGVTTGQTSSDQTSDTRNTDGLS
jgi:hypothetical protein